MNKDIFFDLALELDLKTVLNMCRTSKKLNDVICNNNYFWKRKLEKDYPNTINKFPDNSNYKKMYENIKEIIPYVSHESELFESYDENRIDKNRIDKKILIQGKFPKGTVIWVATENSTPFHNRGFLTEKEAIDYLLKMIISSLKNDYITHREEFIAMFGKTPEEFFGFTYEEALSHFQEELEKGSKIQYPSTEALEAGEEDEYQILKMVIS